MIVYMYMTLKGKGFMVYMVTFPFFLKSIQYSCWLKNNYNNLKKKIKIMDNNTEINCSCEKNYY